MKILILLIILTLNASLLFSQENNRQDPDSMLLELSYRDTNFHMYKIKKITKVKNGYALLLCREIDGKERCFNVVTAKYGKNRQGVRLRRKRCYYLKIHASYKSDLYLNNGLVFDTNIHGKYVAVPPNKWRSNVYTSPNLNGLRYISPSNAQKEDK